MSVVGTAQYESVEGNVMRSFLANEEYVYKTDGSGGVVCRTEDIRAAADALVALADEVETRVVKVSDCVRIVFTPTGSRVEVRPSVGRVFEKATTEYASAILAAYDAGKAARDE